MTKRSPRDGKAPGPPPGAADGPDGARVGLVEWFAPGEYERAECVVQDLRRLGVRRLRTGVSWADWLRPDGPEWYDWLLPRLAAEVEVLPCFLYTPPSMGLRPATSSPPRDPKAFADWLDFVLDRFGKHFEYLELWNEPNNVSEWDYRLDPEWRLFAEMVGGAAYWARRRGWKTVLGGMSPPAPDWLRLMFLRGVMEHIDVVGVHGFPGTWDDGWLGWPTVLGQLQEVLDAHGHAGPIWVTETGFSTWRHQHAECLQRFADAASLPVPRVYWYSLEDLDPYRPTVDGFHVDEREYHFGLRRTNGQRKLLYRLWQQPDPAIARCARPGAHEREKSTSLVIGGAGFIGTNLAHRLVQSGRTVLIYDNLSRPGVEQNLEWLRERYGSAVRFELGDIRDRFTLEQCVRSVREVYHLAAQVAVTTSLADPREDCDVNIGGTLNVLEALRMCASPPALLFTSTNKVYGDLADIELRREGMRYQPVDARVREFGVGEQRPLDFHSPYGCSKGAAEQYVLDYCRTFGIPTTVFRMSCVYGPHQFGTEDQGWVAFFLKQAMADGPLCIYGDGMQVRDVLFVEDLVEAMVLAQEHLREGSPAVCGRAFNMGGGPDRVLSLLELLDRIEELHGHRPAADFGPWRIADQRYYVSDTRRFTAATGWRARTSVRQGIRRLYEWLRGAQPVPAAPLAGSGGSVLVAAKAAPGGKP